MWDPRYIKRIDGRTIPILLILMTISLLILFSTSTPLLVRNQARAFGLGCFVYLLLVCFDYRKLREGTWFFYAGMIVLLVGLFFVSPIHNVRRWYRLPFLPFDIQPSEYAKLALILSLSWFLEKKAHVAHTWRVFFQASLIVFIPFALILKQPDLGTALILCPIALMMFYIGGIKRSIIRGLVFLGSLLFGFVLLIFLGVLSHEEMRPFFTTFIKEYQYERLNPDTYHQKAGQTAIALGNLLGSGFGKSEFTGQQWLPYAYTDSVFPAFTEEFGFIGAVTLLALFFALITFSFQVAERARDPFGKLLAAGISIYLAMHVIINVGMMCGILPITGVPLILISYGGSSVLSTMAALGLLQSIYSRRFTFS